MKQVCRQIFALACALGLSTMPLQAGCDGTWDINGAWEAVQSNGYTIQINVRQVGSEFSGSVAIIKEPEKAPAFTELDSTVSGSISANDISFTARWTSGTVGSYQGFIDDAGNIAGTTFDVNKPNSKAGWHTDRRATCIAAAAPEPAPTHTLGKIPTAQDLATGAAAIGNQDSLTLPTDATRPTATALNDVDVYEGPDGNTAIIGMMAGNTTANILGDSTGWFYLELPIAGGSGWVAADHLKINQ